MKSFSAGKNIVGLLAILFACSCSSGMEMYYMKIADKAFDRRNYDEAKEYYNKALGIDSANANALYKLGVINIVNSKSYNDWKITLNYYTKAAAINPALKGLLTSMAGLKLIFGDTAGAINDLNRAEHTDSANCIPYYYKSMVEFITGDEKGAGADLNKAVALGSDSLNLRVERGLLEVQGNDMMHAWDDFQHAVKTGNRRDKAYWGQAELAIRMHDTTNAIRQMQFAMAEVSAGAEPHRADNLFYLGRWNDLLKNDSLAITYYTQSLDENRYSSKAYFARGCAQLADSLCVNAVNDFDSAIKYGTTLLATYHYYRGMAYKKMGDTLKAANDIKLARMRGYVDVPKKEK